MVYRGIIADHLGRFLIIILKVRLDRSEAKIRHSTALYQQVIENRSQTCLEFFHGVLIDGAEYKAGCCIRQSLTPLKDRYHDRTVPALSVNIDHVATVREARKGLDPDPIRAAALAVQAGAAGITVHLREDRRHIQDADVHRLAEVLRVPLNFEMAATDEMVKIALEIKPHTVMLVPEGRDEITTEGGLNITSQQSRLKELNACFREADIPSSAFIDPDPFQIEAASGCGFSICEIHTGPWAHAVQDHDGQHDSPAAQESLAQVKNAAHLIRQGGMRVNAGHALNYQNVGPIASLDGLCELHIGHAIVSQALFVGMHKAVLDMVDLIKEAAS